MGEFAERPVASGGGDAALVREISAPLFQAKGWMKFLGVLMIIGGILQAITIVGIIICWLPIWVGVLLLKAASGAELAQTGGSKHELIAAMSKIRTIFTIYGILALIAVIIGVIVMIVGGTTALFSALCNV